MSPGRRFRAAIEVERPLQVAGAVNAYFAKLAVRAGFRAVYLSGAGVANAAFGLPDLGLTSLADVVEEARRITAATDLPLLVDADTGFGGPSDVERTMRELARVGVAAVHLEDQVAAKRCGHRPGKRLVPTEEMVERLHAARAGIANDGPVLVARTDAAGVTDIDDAIGRSLAYVEAGAEVIFAEALTSIDEYRRFTDAVAVPVLANMTEFGRSPLLTTGELAEAGVRIVLYPLTAFRAAAAAVVRAYDVLRRDGTQRSILDDLQTRDDLYDVLDYHAHEAAVDRSFREDEP